MTKLATHRGRRFLAILTLFTLVQSVAAVTLPAALQHPGATANAASINVTDGDTVGPGDWGSTGGLDVLSNDGQTLLADTFPNGVVDTDWLDTLGSNDDVCEGEDRTIAKGDITSPEITTPPPQPNGKTDICQVMAEFDPSSSDIERLYVGMLVNSGNGDMSGLVELNQVKNSRSAGDVLFALNWDGNRNAAVESWTWNGTAWIDYKNPSQTGGIGSAHPTRLFGEVSIPLDFIFDNGPGEVCTTFVGGNVYTKTGGGTQGNANLNDSLKDVVGINILISNCTDVNVSVSGACVGGGAAGAVTYAASGWDVPNADVKVFADTNKNGSFDPGTDLEVTDGLPSLPGAGTYFWTATASFPYQIGSGSSGTFTVKDTCTVSITPNITGQCVGGGAEGAVTYRANGYDITGATVTIYSDAAMTNVVPPNDLGGPGTYYWSAVAAPGYALTVSSGSFTVTDNCTQLVNLTIGGQCVGGGEAGAVSFIATGYTGVTGLASISFYADMERTISVDPTALPGPGTYYWSATASPGYQLGVSTGSFTVTDTCTVGIQVVVSGQCVGGAGEAVSFVASGYDVTGATVTIYVDTNGNGILDAGELPIATTLPALPGPGDYVWVATADAGYAITAGATGSFTILDDCTVGVQVAVSGQCVGGGEEGAVSFVASGYDVTGTTVAVHQDLNGNGIVDPGEPEVLTLPNLPSARDYAWVATALPGYVITSGASGSFTVVDDCTVEVTLDIGGQCTLDEGVATLAATGYEVDGVESITFYADAAMTEEVDPTALPSSGTFYWAAVAAPGYVLTATSGSFDVDVSECLASLGDFVWFDEDGDGLQGDDELGVAGVTVNLWSVVDGAPGAILATTTTDADGGYLFDELEAGDYIVQFVLPAGYDGFTTQNVGADDALDSDPDPATGITAVVELAWGETDLTVDAGLVVAPGATSAACEYTEIDIEGVPTMVSLITVTLAGVPGTLVDVLDGDTVVASATLGADGTGSVSFEAGTVTLRSSFAGVVIAEDGPTTFEPCPPDPELGAIGDRVWFDADRDGLQNPNTTLEPGIAGVTVHLYQRVGTDFVPVAAAVTDAEGYYLFDGLEAGEYQVLFVEPASGYDGWTTPNVGSDDAIDSDADPATGRSHIILLGEGQIDLTIDAGLVTIVLDEDEDDDDLPETGFQSGFVALAGAIALGLGSLLVASTRRRNDEEFTTT